MQLYLVLDTVSKQIFEVFFANTDAEALRQNLPALTRYRPKDDLSIIRFCDVDTNCSGIDDVKDLKRNLGSLECVSIPLDSYKFDEITAEHISKTDAQQQILQYRKARELQIAKLELEVQKARKELEKD